MHRYQIRLQREASRDTRILVCTVGILLRRLQSDPALEGVTHIIIDEIHERAIMTDFALAILKDLLTSRPELRLVLVSQLVFFAV